jgi:DNA-binding protein Fis
LIVGVYITQTIPPVLKLNEGNQTRTAGQLQIGSATLYRKLKSYGLIRGRPPE